ncbi:hypothetical protein F511_21317 [Dorcoceras hygrometricum]|uniref:Uncharacterized protein n=1 Tax=Dorcoceras hygrometricum TaxID=472368 RepID=A0A2Z7DCS8_9LAMI|nr:hypothetical protein F511_21317 [Dorcoceras hygrometricum]
MIGSGGKSCKAQGNALESNERRPKTRRSDTRRENRDRISGQRGDSTNRVTVWE